MKVAGAIAILGLALTSSHAAWGQQVAVKGIVHDQAGKPIAQADVVLEKMDGEAIAHATSGGDGAFAFAIDGLNVAQYVLVARKPEYALSTTVIATGTATSVETELVMREQASVTIDIYAKRLDEARNNLSPQTGTSAYLLDAAAIAALPQGPNTPFNQVLEQAPGVARDSFGQLGNTPICNTASMASCCRKALVVLGK